MPRCTAIAVPSIASQRNRIDGELVGPDYRFVEYRAGDDADEQDNHLGHHDERRGHLNDPAEPAFGEALADR